MTAPGEFAYLGMLAVTNAGTLLATVEEQGEER